MKPVSVFIAWRYLFSRKDKTVINIVSGISLAGIAVSTIALVVVLSVYNGIGRLTQSLFNVFDPELIIEPTQGKTFHLSDLPEGLYDSTSVAAMGYPVSAIVEENAWITVHQAESIVKLRGVDASYGRLSGLDTMIFEGQYLLKEDTRDLPTNYLLLGYNIMVRLGVNSMTNRPIAVHIPKRNSASIGFSIDEAFNNGYAYPSGSFHIQEDVDNLYVVADIDFVRRLMNYAPDEVTSLAVNLSGNIGPSNNLSIQKSEKQNVLSSRKIETVKKQLRSLLGPDFSVRDRYEQKPLYYKVFRSERLGVFLILSLIVFIAALNLVASLSLLMVSKRNDSRTLMSMGMEKRDLEKVFIAEGQLISIVGVIIGLVLGFIICILQQQFGIVKLGANAVVDAFPVAMRPIDFISTFVVVVGLSTLVVFFTVKSGQNTQCHA